jgi:hypothetical protein
MASFRRQDKAFKQKQKGDYDRRHRSLPLQPIPNDTQVWVTTEKRTHPVELQRIHPDHNYYSGQIRRNRRQLNVVPTDNDQDGGGHSLTLSPVQIHTRSRTCLPGTQCQAEQI